MNFVILSYYILKKHRPGSICCRGGNALKSQVIIHKNDVDSAGMAGIARNQELAADGIG